MERKRERSMITYMYKIVKGILPNPSFKSNYNKRSKTTVRSTFHPLAPAWVKTLRGRSLFSGGPQLCNTLTREIREQEDIENLSKQQVKKFKLKLDAHLAKIHDIPEKGFLTHC